MPATWHHLAYVFSLGSSSYYYDGKEVAGPISTDPIPATAAGGLWVGGQSTGGGTTTAFPFNGLVDEVRYQSYNPIAAGAFDPTDFLISAPGAGQPRNACRGRRADPPGPPPTPQASL